MPKGRQLLGLPVIAVDSGEVLGQVEELLLDSEHQSLAALVVQGGRWLKPTRLLRWSDVLSVGRDAVTVADESVFHDSQAEESMEGLSVHRNMGLRVVTAGGDDQGTLEDVVIDLPSGQVSGWELSDGLIQDLVSGRTTLPQDQVITIGKDTVVVANSIEGLGEDNEERGLES